MLLSLLYLVIGLVAGGLTAIIGVGSGLVIIPALIFLAHFSTKLAVGTSIALLLPPIGIFAAYSYWKHGDVNVKAAIVIVIGFLIGSFISARFAAGLPSDVLTKVFGFAAIGIGVKMLFF